MMKQKTVRQYVRAVSHKLICSKATRIKLLDGLYQELLAYSALSFDELCAEIGKPDQTADQLMESISDAEIMAAKRKRHLLIVSIVGLLIVLSLVLVVWCVHVQQVLRGDFYVTENFVENEEQIVSNGMIED